MEQENEKMMADYEQMLVSAVRYALGRRSYIVNLTANYISAEIPKLSDYCKKIMICDIEQQKLYGYGDNCDKRDWMELLGKLKKAVEDEKDS